MDGVHTSFAFYRPFSFNAQDKVNKDSLSLIVPLFLLGFKKPKGLFNQYLCKHQSIDFFYFLLKTLCLDIIVNHNILSASEVIPLGQILFMLLLLLKHAFSVSLESVHLIVSVKFELREIQGHIDIVLNRARRYILINKVSILNTLR